MSRAKVQLYVKDPDQWEELASELGISEEMRTSHFEWGEYANLEIEFDEKLNIVGGRVLPLKGKTR